MHRTLLTALLLAVFAPLAWASSDRDDPWASHMEHAKGLGDPLAVRAASYLMEHAPARDRAIDAELLNENLELALLARSEFAWGATVPEEIFLNDVLPYASLDETRERWRPALYAMAKQIVKEAETAGEAAQLLNQRLFNIVGVHYNTGRKRPNQSPFESMKQGRATCTGLSILLVNACRSVGVPARVAGVAEWVSTPGNHTWVEVWDGERWRFTGADEYDARGLDRGWFVGRAAQAIAGSEAHAVWASSWSRNEAHFPMAWNRRDRTVGGIDVTTRYAPDQKQDEAKSATVTRFFRVWDRAGGERVAATVRIEGVEGALVTKAGRADLNDMPSAELMRDGTVVLDVRTPDAAVRTAVDVGSGDTGIIDVFLDAVALTEAAAGELVREAVDQRAGAIRGARADEHREMVVNVGERSMRYLVRSFGDPDAERQPLWISMHGGGGAPSEVNDRQWRNQIRLYEPEQGVYVAPRAPTDTWNLWHRGHIDPLFTRLIETMVVFENVDPDRVYLLGYSAGGDGVYQLAPRIPDRFAAASMMAGHPNEAKPLGLRNLPFAIFMGGDDGAYNRNAVAARWGEELGALRAEDPDGYDHRVTIYEGLGHWMDGRDREALPWMLERTRRVWPERVVWYQDDVVSTRIYWLGVRRGDAAKGQTVVAEVRGQTIEITADAERSPERLTLRLSDQLLDLDRPVRVSVNGEVVFEGRVLRSRHAVKASLEERFDPPGVATALLEIALR